MSYHNNDTRCCRCLLEIDQAIWRLGADVDFISAVEAEIVKAGWHCALGGSVLHEGKSTKDLDLIVYPHKKRGAHCPRKASLRNALVRAGMMLLHSRSWLRRDWRKRGIRDEKWVEVWSAPDGRRIDVLVLS